MILIDKHTFKRTSSRGFLTSNANPYEDWRKGHARCYSITLPLQNTIQDFFHGSGILKQRRQFVKYQLHTGAVHIYVCAEIPGIYRYGIQIFLPHHTYTPPKIHLDNLVHCSPRLTFSIDCTNCFSLSSDKITCTQQLPSLPTLSSVLYCLKNLFKIVLSFDMLWNKGE